MRKLLLLPLLLLASQANAVNVIPHVSCTAQQFGACETTGQAMAFVKSSVEARYGCTPGDGEPCKLKKGTSYTRQANVLTGNGCHIRTYAWAGTVFFKPTNDNHFVHWINETWSFICENDAPNPPQSCGQKN